MGDRYLYDEPDSDPRDRFVAMKVASDLAHAGWPTTGPLPLQAGFHFLLQDNDGSEYNVVITRRLN